MNLSVRDIRYALRRLRGSLGFTVAATVTLTIAIGATASVFGVVDGVLLKAFPYRDPQGALVVFEGNATLPKFAVSPADYLDYRSQNTTLIGLAASEIKELTLTGMTEPERLRGRAVTPNYFPVLGIAPALGRVLAPDSSGPAEVVISYGLWQRRFGGAGSALGQIVTLDAHPYVIVGVTPAGLPGSEDFWTRLSFQGSDQTDRLDHYLLAYARLKPGATVEQAQRDFDVIGRRLAAAYPKTNMGWSALAVPLLDQLVGAVRPALLMLLAAAGCVLLIGVANLANLFLVRYVVRERELALRAALGATRGRIVGELIMEALILGAGAGALGVGVAVAGVHALRALAPPMLPRLSGIGVDARVILFCALSSLATVLVFGVLPAWRVARTTLADVLKEGGRGTGSAAQHRLQNGLVVLQVAIAFVLLTGAGLLVESFDHFRQMDPGFRPDGLVAGQIAFPVGRYGTDDKLTEIAATLVERFAALPGVTAATISDALPGAATTRWAFTIIGDPTPDPAKMPEPYLIATGASYFQTLGIPVVRGRPILATDDFHSQKVVVVDQLSAQRYFGGRDPLGRQIVLAGIADTMVIVGVVKPVKQGGLMAEDSPVIYVPYPQFDALQIDVIVRTRGNPASYIGAMRHTVAEIDRSVPISHIETLDAVMTQSLGITRFSTFLASMFALVALVLGIVGIYSVLMYVVSQRRREIGVRLALGATSGDIVRDVLGRAFALTITGLTLGTVAAWWLTRGLTELFVGVNPHDLGAFAGAAVSFMLAALMAASIPAIRTTRVSPTVALTSTSG